MLKVDAATEQIKDVTQLTASEQAKVDEQILLEWGNPTDSQLVELTSIDANTFKNVVGNKWYYLTQDITTTIDAFSFGTSINNRDIRILMNGYTIDGNFVYRLYSSTTFSIFDRIPNKTGKGYTYNPQPEKYYEYDTETEKYTKRRTSPPTSGQKDVTDMPTYLANSYIRVKGSTFGATETASKWRVIHFYLRDSITELRIYGVNFIGCQQTPNVGNYSVIYGENFALYQCTVIGNTFDYGFINSANTSGSNTGFVVASKIYGNQSEDGGYNSSLVKTAYKSIDIDSTYTVYAFKSNIGVIASKGTAVYRTAYWIKDVQFNGAINLCRDFFATEISKYNDTVGTIELIYNANITYTAKSPNLNFRVRSNSNPNGYNSLTIASGAVVGDVESYLVNASHKKPTILIEDIGSSDASTIRHISTSYLQIPTNTFTYTGSAIEPEVILSNIEGTLVENVDYRVAYENNINAGKATVKIFGIGKYVGVLSTGFIIQTKTIPPEAVQIENAEYTGKEIIPKITVTVDGIVLKEDDFTIDCQNNINAGKARLVLMGQGNYWGIIPKEFTIERTSIAPATITLQQTSYVYSGFEKRPEATVVWKDFTLSKGKDFSLYYENNENVGQAKVILRALGNFKGLRTLHFEILPEDINQATTDVSNTDYVYTGTAYEPSVAVRYTYFNLQQGKDYTLSYENNINAGKATIKLHGQGNFNGTKIVYFTIAKAERPTFALTEIVVTELNIKLSTYNHLLPENWAWENPDFLIVENYWGVTAVYIGADKANYKYTTETVRIKYNLPEAPPQPEQPPENIEVPSPTPQPPIATEPQPTQAKNGIKFIVIGAVVVVALSAVIGVVLFICKKRK